MTSPLIEDAEEEIEAAEEIEAGEEMEEAVAEGEVKSWRQDFLELAEDVAQDADLNTLLSHDYPLTDDNGGCGGEGSGGLGHGHQETQAASYGAKAGAAAAGSAGDVMADNVLKLPALQAASGSAEAKRQGELFDWALGVLTQAGFVKDLRRARTLEDLRDVVFDKDDAAVILAIQAALHPASGARRRDCFRGLTAGSLRRILENKFKSLKEDYEKRLRRGGQSHWSDDLLALDKNGKPLSTLANVEATLRYCPDWQGVLGYNEFTELVVIKKRPPWGRE